MTKSSEILWCKKCNRRETHVVSGSATKAVCLACGREIEDLPAARVKAVMDFTFATLSNGLDK